MPSPHAHRLAALRAELGRREVDGLFLPRTDRQGSEYLPPSEDRIAWLTGFTGSAAQLVVLTDKAAVFSDGRYTVQLEREVDGDLFERCHSVKDPPSAWLERHLGPGARLGYDPFLVRRGERERLAKAAAGRRAELVPLDANPLDAVWLDRPAPPRTPATRLDERWAGEASAAKRQRMGEEIAKKGADALLVTAADLVAWLLNVRGNDVPYNPLCLSYALLAADGTCRWFVDPSKVVSAGLLLDNAVQVELEDGLLPALSALRGKTVAVDLAEAHEGFLTVLEKGGARLLEMTSPLQLGRARKNATEIAGAIAAQRRDGAALVRFLAWLDTQPSGHVDELSAADRLGLERSHDALLRGDSFTTISAHGPHAALPHYRADPSTNRRLDHGTVYLVDSGGQYLDATTDVTRTMALGQVPDEIAERYTLVLKGHLAIADALFPTGTMGSQLDSLARVALWRRGLDFDHGTGHGVGSYLNVHEGPQRIAKRGGDVALEPGMILSNEPGFYKPEGYGIRIENLVVVEARERPAGGDRDMLGFLTLTLCPYDRRLIRPELLDAAEIAAVDAYHARVVAELSPLVGSALAWLEASCRPLERTMTGGPRGP